MGPDDMLRRLVASTRDFAVIECDLDGMVLAWLGAAERVFGYTEAEAIGMSISAHFTPEDLARRLDRHEIAVATTTGRSEDDRWHVRKDGTRFWATGVLTLLRDDDGAPAGLCKVVRDKSDVRTQIEGLEHQVAALRQELAAERRTVGTLAHEIRNPLMPISSALALLQRPDAAQFTARAVGVLTNQVDVLKRLVDDLNATGTVGATGRPMQRLSLAPVDLNAVLSELVGSLQDAARGRGQTLELLLPTTTIEVLADRPRLQQMLINLLNNALKYGGDGGHIGVVVSVEAEMAVIRVEDDGVGIPADVLPRIFELFTREGRHPEIDGQGVGLAVVRQLAAAHGGFVDARSPGAGQGAVFTLRIPVAAGPVASSEANAGTG